MTPAQQHFVARDMNLLGLDGGEAPMTQSVEFDVENGETHALLPRQSASSSEAEPPSVYKSIHRSVQM